jgi:hypothetical protein
MGTDDTRGNNDGLLVGCHDGCSTRRGLQKPMGYHEPWSSAGCCALAASGHAPVAPPTMGMISPW